MADQGFQKNFKKAMAAASPIHQGWNVMLNGKKIDTVFYTAFDADEVRRSLINHDGYDSNITVSKQRRRR